MAPANRPTAPPLKTVAAGSVLEVGPEGVHPLGGEVVDYGAVGRLTTVSPLVFPEGTARS